MNPPKQQPDPSNWWHYSRNQWWGCEKISPACKNCYAESFDKFVGRRMDPHGALHWGRGAPRLWIDGFAASTRQLDAAHARHPEWPRPRVFPNSMNDWLDPAVPPEWLWSLLATIKHCKAMDFLLLTKRPGNFRARLEAVWKAVPEARKSVDWWLGGGRPMNVWAGATVESQDHEERVADLLQIGAAVRWLSVEPAFSELNLVSVGAREEFQFNALQPQGIHWVVAGGESGGQARPSNPQWFHSLRDQCAQTATPFWFKQWGEWVGGRYDIPNARVTLEDGTVWQNPGARQKNSLHFWGFKDGLRGEVVSARVGMKPKPLGRGHELSDNYRLGGQILRELPAPVFPS